jgi:hypothetical protein
MRKNNSNTMEQQFPKAPGKWTNRTVGWWNTIGDCGSSQTDMDMKGALNLLLVGKPM